ncbi:MAG: C10 family peptidase [Alistipes sp.]|nr:C10 family peptidase [Alistipes sp.]
MKRTFTRLLGVLALLMPLWAMAAPVKVEQAKAFATEFFAQHAASRSAVSFELVWDGEQAGGRSVSEPAFYLFNRTDAPGFVLVAGDDASTPILGYSFENNFSTIEGMPANLRWWLDGVRSTILAARQQGAAPHANWSAGGRGLSRAGGEKLLKTANWDQTPPFNNDCPVLPDTSQPALTGCVQTAAAIICQYNQWPASPNGTMAAGYSYKMDNGTSVTIPARTLATSYDYANMPNDYFVYQQGVSKPVAQYTEAQAKAVAVLMADLGVMNKATYDLEGTGAYVQDAYEVMTTYMRYSKQARWLYRSYYSDEIWYRTLKAEIDANRPVLYGGANSDGTGGHAFVMDGYQDGDKFHFNWGWTGAANGWFSVKVMTPVSGMNFNSYQEALVGLEPDRNGTTSYTYDMYLTAGESTTGQYFPGLEVLNKVDPTKQSFNLRVGFLMNLGNAPYSGKIAVAHCDMGGNVKKMLVENSASVAAESGSGYEFEKLKLTSTAVVGDYLAAFYWHNNQWVELEGSTEETVDRIVLIELDQKTLEDGTSLKYDRTTKKLSIKTHAGLKVRLLQGSKAALEVDSTGDWQDITAPAGSYTLRVSEDNKGVSCSVNVKL